MQKQIVDEAIRTLEEQEQNYLEYRKTIKMKKSIEVQRS